MAAPVVGEVAQDVLDNTPVFAGQDSDSNDWGYSRLVDALASALFERIHLLASDTDTTVGWETMLDPEAASAVGHGLEYLSQFSGTTLTDSMSEAEKRAAIAVPEGYRRGNTVAMISAIQRTLTGTKHVAFLERYLGSAYKLGVRTQTSETPDSGATLNSILGQKPVGLVLDFQVIDGNTYAEGLAEDATYADSLAARPTYSDRLLLV